MTANKPPTPPAPWDEPLKSGPHTAAGRGQFALQMEARRQAEATGDFKALPRGWCMGSEPFRQELLLQMTTVQGSKFAGPEWKETGEKKAERILAEELERRGWSFQKSEYLRKPACTYPTKTEQRSRRAKFGTGNSSERVRHLDRLEE